MIYQSKDPNYKRGDRFKRRLPRFVGKIDDFHDLFQAEDKEFEIVDMRLKEFLDALYVHTIKNLEDPDIYLKKLEREWGVISDGSIDERIARVLAKMRGRRTTTEAVVLDICKSFGYVAIYKERYREYGFTVILQNASYFNYLLVSAIDEVKPAHLELKFEFLFASRLELQTRSGDYGYPLYMCGEEICGDIPYPYFEAEATRVKLNLNTAVDDAKNPFALPGTGIKVGVVNDNEVEEILYMSDFNSEDVYSFEGSEDV